MLKLTQRTIGTAKSSPIVKLRVLDNSIRLRLTRPEVDQLGTAGIVSARVAFADDSRLEYTVESSPACVEPVASFSGGSLLVRLPETLVADWSGGEQVSIESEQALTEGGWLRILVEKDFACLSPREGEDESEMFPHPLSGEASC